MGGDLSYRWGITTSGQGDSGGEFLAGQLAAEYGAVFVPRQGRGLASLRREYRLDFLVVLDRENRLFLTEPPLRWHPSMAVPRLRQAAAGGGDVFLTAAGIAPGDQVLDCTLGLAADALLAAWAAGGERGAETIGGQRAAEIAGGQRAAQVRAEAAGSVPDDGGAGRVLGLEASPIIALLTSWGLRWEAARYDHKKTPLLAAAARIRVERAEAGAYLAAQPADSWDVVYFDPMFQRGAYQSASMNSLRPLACYAPFDEAALAAGLRVARKRLVVKERRFSPLFAQLGAQRIHQTKYGPIAYGVWEKG
ncbi:MAG: class I SAM-dependent methyltransferase [Peptococcaceae bacterium]|jgi:hypothetical protein|nr:class I SAM-dependent methyltransferase [Peptococcaceae bacterium]